MAEILRNWRCLNARCAVQFEAWANNPECSKCGCARVQWVPGGGHVAGTRQAADAELRQLADNFGMTNMNSASRDQRAKPTLQQPTMDRNTPNMQFAPGFTAAVHPHQAMCVPSSSKVNFKAKVAANAALPAGQMGFSTVQSGTAIEASHRPPR
jgi:hypothetical protein